MKHVCQMFLRHVLSTAFCHCSRGSFSGPRRPTNHWIPQCSMVNSSNKKTFSDFDKAVESSLLSLRSHVRYVATAQKLQNSRQHWLYLLLCCSTADCKQGIYNIYSNIIVTINITPDVCTHGLRVWERDIQRCSLARSFPSEETSMSSCLPSWQFTSSNQISGPN